MLLTAPGKLLTAHVIPPLQAMSDFSLYVHGFSHPLVKYLYGMFFLKFSSIPCVHFSLFGLLMLIFWSTV